ncbi:MAG: carbamoyl-phosphate synthase large subunit [Desulfatibacillaceae bacterium]|nr:carbamoyl-phosphate synthase large subunit [Desulfatibacillaceae bacterium]
MPKRTDIEKILIIGAGPIIIGQACEFDYSGTQACKALKEEGYEIVLVNSNPATIMTDPATAHRTYIEPVTPQVVAAIVERERPHAVLPTLGGQTGLNTAVACARQGVFEAYGVELIGANVDVIEKAESRERFREAMTKIGLKVPASFFANTLEQAKDAAARIGFPVIIRPSFTLGGTGGGIAYNGEELETIVKRGLDASLTHQVMVEESVLGWKEYELEVMRDVKDNVVIICTIENLDPMGVHTGDSITVAPAQTLSDREYQAMRNASIAVMREIGVETGGSNVQFAINPKNGEMIVIEMNPRVSRSSALASKATGFPIAKIAAKLAVGYTLDEIPNDITRQTLACFEPSIDYCVIKIPRFAFEKFPQTPDALTTSMKSVGETMAIGRTFKEALQKGLRSLEVGRFGLGADGKDEADFAGAAPSKEFIVKMLATPNSKRIFFIRHAFAAGMAVDEIYAITGIDPWFLHHIREIWQMETAIRDAGPTHPTLLAAKRNGFSDRQLAFLWGKSEGEISALRAQHNIYPVYKSVDTCAAEFAAFTPYYYSTYEQEDEVGDSKAKKVMILGGGPNRIGQGIEFDYCCVHASFALAEMGVESIMVNSNPETVSTDYDTSDRLYFEPLTAEDVLHIARKEKPFGVIVQFGGQTPLNIANRLSKAGVPILGTSPESIDKAEDRKLFGAMLKKLNLRQPQNSTALSLDEAMGIAEHIGYPLIVRPSFVLGGRAMHIVYDRDSLAHFARLAFEASEEGHPLLIDRFLENALEVDVDAVCDGRQTIVAGIMEHIEAAGVHSGDSACVLPPKSLSREILSQIRKATAALAAELEVIGLMNIQFAVKDETLYIIEVNPRASRTVPFVSKATGVPWAKVATKVMMGHTLKELGIREIENLPHKAVKEAVFPFDRFPGVDPLLGPEMKSTGEVMGIDKDFGPAFAKAQLAAGQKLVTSGTVFVSVADEDKEKMAGIAADLAKMGFDLVATGGTAAFLTSRGIEAKTINKVSQGRPHAVDAIKNNEIALIVNTGSGQGSKEARDGYEIRRAALTFGVPYVTTMAGALALCQGLYAMKSQKLGVRSLQEYSADVAIN